VRNDNRAYQVTQGLQDRNIALWQSHGWYYEQRTDRWQLQRARVFTTVEDKFTLSYVIPYLAPMLERAGANVFMPRERDTQRNEVIVDNDHTDFTQGRYIEKGKFSSSKNSGFAYSQAVYHDGENPFQAGTYRTIKTDSEESSKAIWIPEIPEDGWYWVSVAYSTEKNSVEDARYTVRHSAGETTFRVNQRMGGGTWIYLGQFYFRKDADAEEASVELSNISQSHGVVVADAVRFGGGMGLSVGGCCRLAYGSYTIDVLRHDIHLLLPIVCMGALLVTTHIGYPVEIHSVQGLYSTSYSSSWCRNHLLYIALFL
jgi:hypothetical protein